MKRQISKGRETKLKTDEQCKICANEDILFKGRLKHKQTATDQTLPAPHPRGRVPNYPPESGSRRPEHIKSWGRQNLTQQYLSNTGSVVHKRET